MFFNYTMMNCCNWELLMYTEQNKKRPSISTRNSMIVKTAQRNCLVWVESAICRESSFAKQKCIVSFCSVQRTVKCSKANNGCDKPCASCTTLHLRGMNGLRWFILVRGMSSQTSWITRHNCTMVPGGGSRDLIWRSPSPMLDEVQDYEYAGQGSVSMAYLGRRLDTVVWHAV